ncbi:hypothetical protein POX_g09375 [Penicillium oxalicum]|uniref:hypothetical protein n=1 Tax=Penicillium oxalicum TaxID=69781 RepID=UPI0020B87F71|nr:hypothetical protein POX_g09375 [Penicillium oxalicum]KAI2786978.1 hypothetical protein POX_g09375 [Penicillium oxalicum]
MIKSRPAYFLSKPPLFPRTGILRDSWNLEAQPSTSSHGVLIAALIHKPFPIGLDCVQNLEHVFAHHIRHGPTGDFSAGAQIPFRQTVVKPNSAGSTFTTAIGLVGQIRDHGHTKWVGYNQGGAEGGADDAGRWPDLLCLDRAVQQCRVG